MRTNAIAEVAKDCLIHMDMASPVTINQAIIKENGIVRFIAALPGSAHDYGGQKISERLRDLGSERAVTGFLNRDILNHLPDREGE